MVIQNSYLFAVSPDLVVRLGCFTVCGTSEHLSQSCRCTQEDSRGAEGWVEQTPQSP